MCTIRYGYIDVYKRAFHAYLCCLGNCLRPSCKRISKCFAVKSEVLERIVGSKGLGFTIGRLFGSYSGLMFRWRWTLLEVIDFSLKATYKGSKHRGGT